MARYTGPKTKIARKFGEAIFGDDKSFEKRNYPPGQHGNKRRRGKKDGGFSCSKNKKVGRGGQYRPHPSFVKEEWGPVAPALHLVAPPAPPPRESKETS